MTDKHDSLPDLQALTEGLTSVLVASGCGSPPVTVLEREAGLQGSFPSELVVCRLGNGRKLKLHCKYGSEVNRHFLHGVRRGVAYEAGFYRDILPRVGLSAPAFYGTHIDAAGRLWLVLGHVENAVRVEKGEDSDVVLAARWIGSFHARTEELLACGGLPELPRYNADFYLGWVRRMCQFAAALPEPPPWLERFTGAFAGVAETLCAVPATVIHGEYYPVNLLLAGGVVYPVDWESAAIAAGEIDLATLIEGWDADAVEECELAYRDARWPSGSPDGFAATLDRARVFVGVRWLGDELESTIRSSSGFEELRKLSEELGLL